MLDYPMVDFVALRRAALTTPFFKDHLFTIFCQLICLHFLAVLFNFFSWFVYIWSLCFDDGYDSRWKSNGVCFRRHSGKFFTDFFFSLENFQIFWVEREIFVFLNWGNNSPLWKGGRGEKYLVWRFF